MKTLIDTLLTTHSRYAPPKPTTPPANRSDLETRYEQFMSQPSVRSLLRRGGQVFIATEHRPQSVIQTLMDLGHRCFAEKFVQETATKWPSLRASGSDIRLHHYGRLQTNKVRRAISLVDGIESVDRPRLAAAIAATVMGIESPPSLCVQVNTGREAQKGGVDPSHADHFIRVCREEFGLSVSGLMAIPPRHEDPQPHFRLVRRLADRHHLHTCIMGMSGDYEAAIDCGSTAIRVARILFEPKVG